jgi:cobalt/nickel transport system permease protein
LLELFRYRLSPIHQLDARVKIIFTLAFILAISLTPSGAWPAFILFLSIDISVNLLSKLSIGFVQKRALLVLPFILSAIPLIFLGPQPVITFTPGSNLIIPISTQGVIRFISIAFKAWISVQMAILLASSTPFSEILSGFRLLHIPGIFISIIEMMWRYLFLMVAEVGRMIRARASRSSRPSDRRSSGGSIIWRAFVTGGMAGSLFVRSIERSERVYAAMLSRGYNGEPITMTNNSLGKNDLLIVFISIVMFILILFIGLIFGA